MSDKSLKDKAIDFKGKPYVQVSDRVLYFNETYDKGSITTELVSSPQDDMVVVKATIKPVEGENRAFTGYSQATWDDGYINKTSALENAETSAVGRALAFMGIGVIESIASADEINKAQTQPPKKKATEKMTSEQAKERAMGAIETANNVWNLDEVKKNIDKSPYLNDEDKDALYFAITERRASFDPTE